MPVKNDLENLMERVKEFLPQYLESNAVHLTPKSTFRCINPDHNDTNPSAGIVPTSDGKVFHCFTCLVSGSIFLAAHYLEGKPLAGPGFVTDNVIYLAKKFGIDVPSMGDLNDEDLHEMELFRAYQNASYIIKNSEFSQKVKDKIAILGWPENPMKQVGVGSVVSYNDFIHKMTTVYKHKMEFLKEADLDRKVMFNENSLIFSIKDENGNVVGFAARNLRYEEEKAEYDKSQQMELELGQPNESKSFVWKPVKYINTDVKCYIYKKSKRLFNFNLARKAAPPLYVFEGYADCMTAYVAGLKNSCSIGSTSFSKDHLDLVLETGIKHIIFVLDADKAGEVGTDRFVKLLEENVGGRVGLRAEIVIMPEGSDDPDAFIRGYGYKDGLQQFLKLEKLDIFSWSLRKGISNGKDPITLASESIPLIVNEPNFLIRMSMADKLVAETGLPKSGIWGEIMRQVDSETSRMQEERVSIAKWASKELLSSGKDLEVVLEAAKHKVEVLQNTKLGFDPSNVSKCISIVMERAEKMKDKIELYLGYDYLDSCLGVPSGECFICLPGKPNQGKSTVLDNFAWRILEKNPKAIVFFHSVDDALSARIPRLLGSKYNIPSKYFKQAGYYLEHPPEDCPKFPEKYQEAMKWLQHMVTSERLVLADVSMLSQSLVALDNWVKTIRARNPDKQLVVMGDNFHLYHLPGHDQGEEKLRNMSSYIKAMCNKHQAVGMFTMELPKEALRPGVRPRISKIKGSSGPAYDANVNFGVYNDLKDMGADRSEVYWRDTNSMETLTDPNGVEVQTPMRKPIIELVIDKSKISSFDGVIFFKLDPVTGRLDECSPAEQAHYTEKTSQSTSKKTEYSYAN